MRPEFLLRLKRVIADYILSDLKQEVAAVVKEQLDKAADQVKALEQRLLDTAESIQQGIFERTQKMAQESLEPLHDDIEKAKVLADQLKLLTKQLEQVKQQLEQDRGLLQKLLRF